MALPVIDFNTGTVVETDPFLATEAADFSTPESGFWPSCRWARRYIWRG